jgi:septum site-determining protein MinD
MARRIVITSGKGGVGKTTICANLGYALAKNNQKVLLLDADIGLNNLDVIMGVENRIIYDLLDVVSGRCRVRQALVQDFNLFNLFILPSNRAYCNLDVDGEILKEILNELDEYFDYIIIDCPAGIENGFYRAVSCSKEAIIVTTPHLSAIRDAYKVINILQKNDIEILGVVVNRLRGDLILLKEMLSVEKISEYLKLSVVGAVPEDDTVISCKSLLGEGLMQSNSFNKSFHYIVNKIHCGEYKVFDCTKRYRGIVGSIRRRLKRWV